MATITNLGFSIMSTWDGVGVQQAMTALSELQVEMRRISGAALAIDVVVNDAKAKEQLATLRTQAANETVVIKVVAETETASASLKATADATAQTGAAATVTGQKFAAMSTDITAGSTAVRDSMIITASEFEASGRTMATSQDAVIKAVQNLAIAEKNLQTIQDTGVVSSTNLMRAQAGLEGAHAKLAVAVDGTAASIQREEALMAEMAGATARMSAAMDAAVANATAANAALSSSMAATEGKVAAMNGALMTAGKVGAVAFVAGTALAVNAAADFQETQTRLVTSAGMAAGSLDMVSEGILRMSGEVGVSAEDLSKAMYTVSSGMVRTGDDTKDAATALDILKASAEGAKMEGAELATVSNAVTTVLADYTGKGLNAADVTSQLVTAVANGKTNMQDFSESLHSVLPFAAGLNLSVADITGTLAEMTTHGVSAAQSSQNLADVLRHVQSATGPMRQELQQLDMTSEDLADMLGEKGISGTIDTMTQKILDKMGPSGKMMLDSFNSSKSAAANLTSAIDQLSSGVEEFPDAERLAALATQMRDGDITAKEFRAGLNGLSQEAKMSGAGLASMMDKSEGFTNSMKNGGPQAQTYGQAVQALFGDVAGLNVAMQVGGVNAEETARKVGLVADATKEADGSVKGWSEVQGNFNQSLSEAGHSIGAMAIELGTALLPALTTAMNGVVAATQWLGEHKIVLYTVVAAVGALAIAWVAATFPITSVVLLVTGIGIALMALEQKTHIFSNAWKAIWSVIGEPLKAFGGFMMDLGNMAKEYLGDRLGRIWEAIKAGVQDVSNKVKPPLDSLFNVIRDGMQRAAPFLDVFKHAFEVLGVVVPPIIRIMMAEFRTIGEIVWSVLQGSIKPVFNTIGDIFNGVINVIRGIVTVIEGMMRTVKGVFEVIFNFFKGFVSVIVDLFHGDFQGAIQAAKDALSGMWNGVKDIWNGIMQQIQGIVIIIKAIWDSIVSVFENAGRVVWNIVNAFIGRIIDFFTHLWDVLVGHSIVPDMINAIIHWFTELPNKVVAIVVGFVMDVITWFVQLGVRAYEKIKPLIDKVIDLWNGFHDAIFKVLGYIHQKWDDFINGIKIIWDTFSIAFTALWNTFWDNISAFINKIVDGIKEMWDRELRGLRKIWDDVSGAFQNAWNGFWDKINEYINKIVAGIKEMWDRELRGFRKIYDDFVQPFVDAWFGFWDNVRQTAEDIWNKVTAKFEGVKDAIKTTIQTLKDDVKSIWDGIVEIFKSPVNGVINIWNGVSGVFGLPDIPHMATGGQVDGYGGSVGDKVPTMLSNSEHVFTSADVAAMGGHDNVYAFRSALHGTQPKERQGDIKLDNQYADGGQVRPASLDPTLAMAREKGDNRPYVYGGAGPDGFDCSGYMSAIFNSLTGRSLWSRSFTTESDFQALGFERGLGAGFSIGVLNGGGGMNSHMAGTLDGNNVESGGPHNSTLFGPGAAGADNPEFGSQYHLKLVNGEFVSGGMGGANAGPTPAQIAAHDRAVAQINDLIGATDATSASKKFGVAKAERVPLALMDLKSAAGFFAPAGDVHAAGTQKDGLGAIGKLDTALASMHSAIGGNVPTGDRLAMIDEALALTNTPPPSSKAAWEAGMNTLVERESGWNTGAVNNTDINAQNGNASRGLAQVIPTTFASYKVAGHDNIDAAVDNLAASINYIKATYGTIENVQQANANMAPKGYAQGTVNAQSGWNMVGENGPEMVNFRGGETVKSFDQIIATLKEAARTDGQALQTKVTADFNATATRIVEAAKAGNTDLRATIETEIRAMVAQVSKDTKASGDKVAVTLEEAIDKMLASAGIKIDLSSAGGDVNALVAQVQQQLVPQLEMLLRQKIGANA